MRTTSRPGRLQKDLLAAFLECEPRFFLTGEAAPAGFHLAHRETQDLDPFTTGDALDEGGAAIEPILKSPNLRRYRVRRGNDAVLVDLVRERVPQIVPDKLVLRGIRVDPAA